MHLKSNGLRKLHAIRPILVFALLFGSFFFPTGCRNEKTEKSFILITLDTQRADHVSAYADHSVSTPHIDSLAAEGMLFENGFSPIPITLPAHAAMFFSQSPHGMKLYNNHQKHEPVEDRPSLAAVFRNHGFETAAFVSLGTLQAGTGMNEGFNLFDDRFPEGQWYLSAEEVNRRVFPWLERHREDKFFLWIHYSDPHEPYSPPSDPIDLELKLNDRSLEDTRLNMNVTREVTLNLQPGTNRLRFKVENPVKKNRGGFYAKFFTLEFSPGSEDGGLTVTRSKGWSDPAKTGNLLCREEALIVIENKGEPRDITMTFRGILILGDEGIKSQYAREVEYMDGEIGRFFDRLKELALFDNTNILLVGDHGEGLGEYDGPQGQLHFGHIHYLYSSYTKVPFIYYDPDSAQKGAVEKHTVSLLDIAPTVLEVMGFKKQPFHEGENFLVPEKKQARFLFQETYRPEASREKFAVLRFPWHLILTPETRTYELFDLRTDPEEQENLFREDELPPEVRELKTALDAEAIQILKNKIEVQTDKGSEEMLKALGYIK